MTDPTGREPGGDRGGLLARHWLIVALLVVGGALRLMAWIAYQPALLYGDSFRYLANVGEYDPAGLHPIGYSLFVLAPVLAVDGLELVTALQHLAVMAAAVALYVLALRHGVRRWLAAVAAAPLLLDAYQLQIEQMIMADAWQQVILVAMLWLLLARGAPSPQRAAVTGLLLGIAVLLRLIAVSLAVPVLCYLVIAGGAWRTLRTWHGWRTIGARSLAFVVLLAIVLTGYATYFHAETGKWGLSRSTGNVLYGRASVVADCDRLELDPILRKACPDEPLGRRKGIDYYAHRAANKSWRDRFPPGADLTSIQERFGKAVIAGQPLDVAGAVTVDFLKGFRPIRVDSPGDVSVDRWRFTRDYQYYSHREFSTRTALEHSGEKPSGIPAIGTVLRGYQLSIGYTPGTLLGIFGLLALVAGFGFGNARSSGIRSAMLLSAGMAVTILYASAAFEFSWRYQLPGLVLLPFAGVLAITALRGRRRPG